MSIRFHRSFWLTLVAILVAPFLLVGLAAAPAGARTSHEVWHRFNVYEQLNDSPSHERLRCLIKGEDWRCKYDTVPEPTLGFSNPSDKAVFVGEESTDSWVCPDWFDQELCGSVVRVVSGTLTFIGRGGNVLFDVPASYVLTEDGVLWNYWQDLFVCPWYSSFGEALSSPAECTFAP